MKKTGVVIVAAGQVPAGSGVSPLQQLGSISVIKRMVLTFQQADVSPIVIITGWQSVELEQHLADYGVIFIRNENYQHSDKFTLACLGLRFLQDKCQQLFFTSVSIPMYTAATIRQMAGMNRRLVIPSYHGRTGHPLLLNAALIPSLLTYDEGGGMRAALHQMRTRRTYLEVEDEGILLDIGELQARGSFIEQHTRRLLHPFIRVSIERDQLFFNARARLLLQLIQEAHSVKEACRHMALSLGKAWNMLNAMEKELGFCVVERRRGGNRGGKTELTPEGRQFLADYQRFEQDIQKFAEGHFQKIFQKYPL